MSGILFVACTSVGRALITELRTNPDLSDIEIAGIVNLNEEIALSKSNYDSYSDIVRNYDIPIYYCRNINDLDTVEWMKRLAPDIIIQSGWSQKFCSDVLSIPRLMCIGEHPSPLPRGRGAACVNWAILNGEKDWGDSYFKMEDSYDTGVILAQKKFQLMPYDDVGTAYTKVAEASRLIIQQNVRKWLNGEFQLIEQDESSATYYKKRQPDDGYIDFSISSSQLVRLIRAVTKPYPGAFFIDSQTSRRIYVWRAQLVNLRFSAPSSKVVGVTPNGGILVVCGDGNCMELLRVQPEDDEEKWAAEWCGTREFLTSK